MNSRAYRSPFDLLIFEFYICNEKQLDFTITKLQYQINNFNKKRSKTCVRMARAGIELATFRIPSLFCKRNC